MVPEDDGRRRFKGISDREGILLGFGFPDMAVPLGLDPFVPRGSGELLFGLEIEPDQWLGLG